MCAYLIPMNNEAGKYVALKTGPKEPITTNRERLVNTLSIKQVNILKN